MVFLVAMALGASFCLNSCARCAARKPQPAKPEVVSEAEIVGELVERTGGAVVAVVATIVMRLPPRPAPFRDPLFRRDYCPLSTTTDGGPAAVPARHHSLGSGVIIASDGLVITNHHVIADADGIQVILGDGRYFAARVVGSDGPSDIALLRLDGSPKDLAFLDWGDSNNLRVGQPVVALSNPYGAATRVSRGIVSVVGRSDVAVVDYEDLIQTDAVLTLGSSGGALIDLEGKLIGITTAVSADADRQCAGVGLAIASNVARSIVRRLLEQKRIARGWIGLVLRESDNHRTEEQHPLIQVIDVVPGSPAARAGLLPGDQLLAIDGTPVTSCHDARNLIAAQSPESKIKIGLIRGTKRHQITVRLVSMPRDGDTFTTAQFSVATGLVLRDLTPELRSLHSLPESLSGVFVDSVAPGSPAAAAQIDAGDVITRVQQQPVDAVEQVLGYYRQMDTDQVMTLLIYRDGQSIYRILEK